jgi:hypothetical protein
MTLKRLVFDPVRGAESMIGASEVQADAIDRTAGATPATGATIRD